MYCHGTCFLLQFPKCPFEPWHIFACFRIKLRQSFEAFSMHTNKKGYLRIFEVDFGTQNIVASTAHQPMVCWFTVNASGLLFKVDLCT